MKPTFIALLALCLVGCGKKKEKAAAAETKVAATEAKAAAEAKAKAVIEAAIRKAAKKPEGELTKVDLGKVTRLYIHDYRLTDVKGLNLIITRPSQW